MTTIIIDKSKLSKREHECLHWLARGKTLDETAIILGIKPRTVKAHVKAVKDKTGSVNQFQLGMMYVMMKCELSD